MATHFGEQAMEHRLELAPLAQLLFSDGRITREDMLRVTRNAPKPAVISATSDHANGAIRPPNGLAPNRCIVRLVQKPAVV